MSRLLSVFFLSWACAPVSALACSVCQDPNDPRAGAYFNMTLFLSLLPIGAMGLVAWWLYRRFQEAEPASAQL